MKLIKYCTINAAFVALIYFGFVEHVEGAKNVALFMAWIVIILSLCMQHKEVLKEIDSERSVPRWIDIFFDVCVSGVFIWFGAWLTGVLYFIHIAFVQIALDKVKELKEKKS